MVKKLDYTVLEDYPQYLKDVRGYDESRIMSLCAPLIRLITERGYSTEQFLVDSYETIYEMMTGKPYRAKSGRAVRQAINNYRSYQNMKEEKKE